MNTITDDWVKHTWPIKTTDGAEYSVTCHVYLRIRKVPDEYSRTGRDEQICDWSLEGWETVPEQTPEQSEEIELQLLQRLTDEYGPN